MIIILILALSFCRLIYVLFTSGGRGKNLPPGPPTFPILGNLHQLPRTGTFLKFTEWSKKYGKIFSLKIGSGRAIVLTDRQLIREIIDKRSSKYSQRPPSYVSDKLITQGEHFLVMQYGPLWRTFRKLAHQNFMESVVERDYLPIQNAEAVQMLLDICRSPGQHMLHPKRFSNSIAMSLIFGMRTPEIDTPHMTDLYKIMEDWVHIMGPGAAPPVDVFPIFHLLPERFWGNWIQRSKRVGSNMNILYTKLLAEIRQRHENPAYQRTSLMDSVLDQNEKFGLTDYQMYFFCGVLVEGASDTTATAILSFIHAMTKWPGVLRKAQEEVDSVVGEGRSPVWEDYACMPYVAATVKEAMRWRAVVPLAFPHAATEDDWIDGYFIPKGSALYINVWGLHHDPAYFSNPEIFDPDHFKGKTALAPELASVTDVDLRDHYGYESGRRICPGMHVAERNLFLAIAKLIWAFDIGPGVDEKTGLPIEPDVDAQTGYQEGLILGARPFPCRMSVRSEARRDAIVREFQKVNADVFSKFAF